MKILFFIHGGDPWKDEESFMQNLKDLNIQNPFYIKIEKWKDCFFNDLKHKNWSIIYPDMPCADNAKYEYWKIIFEKYLTFSNKNTVFVGHSLGASFLIQYFQNNMNYSFRQLHLVAPAYNLNLGGFKHNKDFSNLEKQFDDIFIYHSKDDVVVPFEDSERLHKLINKSKFIKYTDRNHFFDHRSPEIEKNLF